MTIHYGDIDVNESMLLDLPMTEGIGTILHDVATPSRLVTLTGAPTWTALASGLMTLNFDGETQYGVCANANCADLEFTDGDYTILGVLNWTVDEYSQIVVARYELSVGGWELYLTQAAGGNYLTIRHHHAGGASLRTAIYSLGWTPGTTWVYGISRHGAAAQFYRDGEPVTSIGDLLIDPEATTKDLVIGVRYSKNANFFKNTLYRPRIIGAALTASQHKTAYELIKEWL